MTVIRDVGDFIKETSARQNTAFPVNAGTVKSHTLITDLLQFSRKFTTVKITVGTLGERSHVLGVTPRTLMFDGSIVTFHRVVIPDLYTVETYVNPNRV